MNNRGRPAFRSAQVLLYARETLCADGVAPSYGMICDHLGIRSRQEVSRIVARLERDGALSRVGKGRVRRIRLGASA